MTTKISSIKQTSAFKKDIKTYKHNTKVLNELDKVIDMILHNITLPPKYKLHPLKGTYRGAFDCHIFPNIILIYHIENNTLILSRIGSHNKLELTESIPSKISYIDITDVHYFGVKPKKPQSLSTYLKKKRIKSK